MWPSRQYSLTNQLSTLYLLATTAAFQFFLFNQIMHLDTFSKLIKLSTTYFWTKKVFSTKCFYLISSPKWSTFFQKSVSIGCLSRHLINSNSRWITDLQTILQRCLMLCYRHWLNCCHVTDSSKIYLLTKRSSLGSSILRVTSSILRATLGPEIDIHEKTHPKYWV